MNKIHQIMLISMGLLMLSACDVVPNEVSAKQTSPSQLVAGILPVDVAINTSTTEAETTTAAAKGTQRTNEILFYLENNTSRPISVLPWNTPMEKFLSADLFSVTFEGKQLPYTGRVVKRAAPEAKDYINLAAGERLESLVMLSQGYDISQPGEYKVVLESLSLQDSSGVLDVVIADTTLSFTNTW